ncbi:fumarylacetoacetate hydrolase family protein [Litorihabitans aurantiacus]|uniref:2-hydroxyhepta-2,4-diene-1,7-dioate isomerase n=1 Tax=Litorihabitans aurantiacus TaxID=1930061 RepID=A0AA37XER5_9MICO|nr:fumarylacetoacetate hydrolase family protein [Litorihabitans aurantiacus]GMA31978.1 2-hydroxyhepta-2,4-diene-1,7-dioate isomerase [Litorihabitans aurantiacus]
MRLARIGDVGQERPVVVVDGRAHDLSGLTPDLDGRFLAADGIARVREALAAGLPEVPLDGVRIGAPIARPSAVVCIGMNYAAHAAESGSAPPERPVVFLKHPNTVVGAFDDVVIPARSTRTDWEVELAVVIGSHAYELDSDEAALAAVAGYTVADDLSERAWQLEESGGQWSKGKCGPGFTPTGPWLVPADEIDPGRLRLRSRVNGEPRQDSTTADLIFDVPTVLRELSHYMALEPGDLVLTGTPEGVALSGRFPYLAPGDVVEIEIDGLGRQRHALVAPGARDVR